MEETEKTRFGKPVFKKKNADFSEESSDRRMRQSIENDRIDAKFDFSRTTDFTERIGFMINMHSTEILDENKRLVAAVDFYFLKEDGGRFKATVVYPPYFYVLVKQECMRDLSAFLKKKYDGAVTQIDVISKEDLDLPNHLIGLKQRYLKLSFPSMTELMKVRRDILAVVRKNKKKSKSNTLYAQMMSNMMNSGTNENGKQYSDQMENILDIREYDVPYHARVCIDLKLFAGLWYSVQSRGREPVIITRRPDLIETPDLIVLAYDIECTKQPLKFPDAAADQIMMISYMVDGQGYLINNRQVISADVEDFEYTPYPEYEGQFIVVNEPDEKSVLERFFEHIADVKPHVIATYNGDNFDWPYVEQRAAVHGLTMALDIGFSGKDGVFSSRPIIHMDCLCWVKRDSYLPVGSQNLKAVAKAKLRYDPVEIDPEDMCAMAAEQPQTMCNYSVSDAVATYYLYMKYVHPFIFALCTILPMEPDEALRKGSGTLCELLLMVEAYNVNIVFPNKQEEELNKATADGHILDSETYVGGHVEALESGVFRADIPCRFKLDPDGVEKLIKDVPKALAHAIEEEEKVPLDKVENLDEVVKSIQEKLQVLRDHPARVEPPVIIHLDVGAMYPNIILTNRLQPSAVVNEEICATCDFNRPNSTCQRNMKWTWRGECMPASRNEFLSIQQQLETEKFPPALPGGPQRAFHQLSREEAAGAEKSRLAAYCRRAYKKTHVTRIEERTSTICQMENSFYVDTVRAFRDRRYEYKGLGKDAKKAVVVAVAGGDAREIKSAKNREVLYDSLQLAHKCILNSFYGYVMRRGARWYSMEMAGIVCHTGANIIMKACQMVEKVGRPLELDTDGIWCILPSSFPQDYTVTTTHDKKKKLSISYPNAILNCMVKEHFTNEQYHDLVDQSTLKYSQRSENTIFFEVDGPYLAMVLPASKEKEKKLKKRYAVFNFDKSLAELKGFEVKRRGELQLIKIFQSSVFESFLSGDTLEKCYEAVAKVADYWLDVLYSKASNMPDSELFELISEKKSMSKKLEDYGAQKSTSISTAKRLAEFLGDQMVKDKGLACRFIISRKPEGAPVTERAIPLAIFQSEPSVKRHFLRKWLKDSSLTDVDIRQVLDWNYYIERLNGTIQKIITIPAALQGVANPVPRVRHPDWLHKEILERDDVLKQRKMNEFFKPVSKPESGVSYKNVPDVEDIAGGARQTDGPRPIVNRKRKRGESSYSEEELSLSWREALGPPPPLGKSRSEHVVWLEYQKKKWLLQLAQRRHRSGEGPRKKGTGQNVNVMRNTGTIAGFIKKAQRTILDCPWQVIQFVETNDPGVFRVWALVGKELHVIKLTVPRIFYVNKRTPRPESDSATCRKASRQLPRSRPTLHLYEYTVSERDFQEQSESFLADLSTTDVEGIYETQMPLDFRLLVTLGCCCSVDRKAASQLIREGMKDTDTFSMLHLIFRKVSDQPYLENLPEGGFPLKHIFLYQHNSANGQRAIYAVFFAASNKTVVFVVDSVVSKTFPNAHQVYVAERNNLIQELGSDENVPGEAMEFEVQHLVDAKQMHRALQRALQKYRDEKRGATMVVAQTAIDSSRLVAAMPELASFPIVSIHKPDSASLYSTMEWQKVGARTVIRHYLRLNSTLNKLIDHCRYLHIPIGNMPADSAIFGADLFFARHLLKNNLVLWCSPTPLPDLGGRQADDSRLLSELDDEGTSMVNSPGAYSSICIELDVDALAVNTLLQSHHVQDIEGTCANIAFDAAPVVRVDDLLTGPNTIVEGDEESALSALSGVTFRVLRATVATWLRHIALYRNVHADQLVTHFYRWLRNPNALLYDPGLYKTLHQLMKKLFVQLVAEFRRLGSVVVHADFSKIIICTRKVTDDDAVGYVRYILASVRNKELFHSVHIAPSQSWEYLLWLDPGNYGGVRGKSQEEEDMTDDSCPVVMNWSLAERLPTERQVRDSFTNLIANYMVSIWTRLQEGRSQLACASPVRKATPDPFSQVQSTPLGVALDDSLKQFTIEMITGAMSQKLFTLVQKIHERLPTAKCTAIGMNGETIVPALEFTKAVTKVLELDKCLSEPVACLRRNMLKLLGVGEFSEEAAWKDPCVPAILPEVICSNCNHCRDLDLCNDPYRVEVDDRPAWACSVCETCYDRNDIEFQLMENIQKKIISYNLQDLQCSKCRQIQADNLSQYCSCAGNYKTLISSDALTAYLTTIESVAHYYQLPLLGESIGWMKTLMQGRSAS